MSSPNIAELIQLANEMILAKADQRVTKVPTKVQERILQQALEGKQLKDIRVVGYQDGVVQKVFAPRVWKLLSEEIGEKVTIKTLRLLLEDFWQRQHHPEKQPLIKPVPPASLSFASPTRHNLPAPSCTEFIGREEEIARLLELLSPMHRAGLISIDGIGGVGKTTLVVEVAYQCLNASNNPDEAFLGIPTFDVIIFTSAKQHILAPVGLLQRLNPKRTLRDIFRQIANTLKSVDIAGKSLEDQVDCLQEALSRQRSLLIVDNLETVEDPQDVLSFLYDLPPTVKAVITTRKQSVVFVPLRLASLLEPDALRLIEHEAREKQVILNQDESYELYQKTGGIPVAINYAIGQMASGHLVKDVLKQLSNAEGDVARFLFESSIAPLREHDQVAYQFLMGLTFFSTPAQRQTLIEVILADSDANWDDQHSDQIARSALIRLQGLSLVRQEQERYNMLPLTREYAIAELKKHPTFEQAARERWIRWWLSFVEQYGRQEIWDWQSRNEVIEAEWPNIQMVIEWCLLSERHTELYQIWKCLEAHIHLQGHRSKRSICWGDRLDWIKWLIQTAKKNGQLATAAEVMVSRGWLLTTMGQLEDLDTADRLFTEVWSDLRHHLTISLQLSLAVNIVALRVRQQKLDEAQTWLNQAVEILEQNQIENSERLSQLSRMEYCRGRICFSQGEYEQSKSHFQQALNYAETVGWQMGVDRSSNWLADVAIKQRKFAEAKQLLIDRLQVAEANKEVYQIAFCERSLANLTADQGDRHTAYHWAMKALENFKSLDMLSEAEETQTFLQKLGVEFTELND